MYYTVEKEKKKQRKTDNTIHAIAQEKKKIVYTFFNNLFPPGLSI